LKHDLVNRLDPRFNKLLGEEIVERYLFLIFDELRDDDRIKALCVNTAFNNAFFLHFIEKDVGGYIDLLLPEESWQTLHAAVTGKLGGDG
jgi:hypothetical protein